MRETLDDLLSQWEQGYERGQPPSAEMLCAEHPKLLEHLRGSPWESLAEVQVKAAREKKKQQDRNPDKSN